MAVPLIYNLFPRLAGPIPHWLAHARRAAEPGRLIRLMRDWDPPQGEPAEGRLELHPAEVCVLIG